MYTLLESNKAPENKGPQPEIPGRVYMDWIHLLTTVNLLVRDVCSLSALMQMFETSKFPCDFCVTRHVKHFLPTTKPTRIDVCWQIQGRLDNYLVWWFCMILLHHSLGCLSSKFFGHHLDSFGFCFFSGDFQPKPSMDCHYSWGPWGQIHPNLLHGFHHWNWMCGRILHMKVAMKVAIFFYLEKAYFQWHFLR